MCYLVIILYELLGVAIFFLKLLTESLLVEGLFLRRDILICFLECGCHAPLANGSAGSAQAYILALGVSCIPQVWVVTKTLIFLVDIYNLNDNNIPSG